MRIGVDYRVLAVGRAMIDRGLGRFTQQQLRAVLEHDATNEYVLLCPAGADLALVDRAVRRAPNVTLQHFTPSRAATVPTHPDVYLRVAEEFQQWVAAQSIDLYHATTPFVPEPPLLVGFDACPMVATFYDAIPLVFPAHYLTGWWEEQYERTLSLLLSARRLIAISASARDDAVHYLGFPRDQVDVVWPVADPCFTVLPPDDVRSTLANLRRRVAVPDRFIMTVSHFHHTKNLQTLLRAYSLLARDQRAEVPLVICCHLDADEARLLAQMVADLDLADCVVPTNLVSDAELAALYNTASVVIHPSRYEGFGLPVVEAMSCGAPVITTTSSSLPEVAGGAAVLVDPDDAEGMADSIRGLLADSSRRADMVDQGLAHVRTFDIEQLALKTLASYRRAVVPPPDTGRPRVAVWTPLPPQPTGIADYSAELLDGLGARYEVEVFVGDGCLPPARLLRQHRVQHFTAFGRRHEQKPFDVVVYQLGRSLLHLYMREAMLDHPGIAVLHDLAWSHVLHADTENRGRAAQFRRQLVTAEGEEAGRELDTVARLSGPIRGRLADDLLYRYPMLSEVVAAGLAQVVHVDEAASELARRCPSATVSTVPMGVADPFVGNPTAASRKARSDEAIPPAAFVVAAFGAVHPMKRLEACVRALPQVAQRRPGTMLLIVGGESEAGYVDHLNALAEELGVSSLVRFTGHVGRPRFDTLMIASNVVVNLRTPSALHMSAVVLRAAAAGKPSLITDLPEWRMLPDQPFIRIPPGDGETPALVTELISLATNPGRYRLACAGARSYWAAEATVERMADGYAKVIDAVLAQTSRRDLAATSPR